LACERPPRPLQVRWLRTIFLDVASTPPHGGGEYCLSQPIHSHLHAEVFHENKARRPVASVRSVNVRASHKNGNSAKKFQSSWTALPVQRSIISVFSVTQAADSIGFTW
jgi:hypothetical protein